MPSSFIMHFQKWSFKNVTWQCIIHNLKVINDSGADFLLFTIIPLINKQASPGALLEPCHRNAQLFSGSRQLARIDRDW